jgi:hypothetical protein
MANQDNENINEIFTELNLYLQKVGNLYTREIDIEDLEDDDAIHEIIESLTRKVLQRPSAEALNGIEIAINEIEELQNKEGSIMDNTRFMTSENGVQVLIEGKEAVFYQNEFYNKYLIEFYFLKGNLISLKHRIEKRLVLTIKRGEEVESTQDDKVDNQVPLPTVILDRYQSALLFHYFTEIKLIRAHSKIKLGEIISILTGHSPNTTAKKALGPIDNVKKDIAVNRDEKQGKHYNLNKVRQALSTVIDLIDKDIKWIDKIRSRK